MSRVASIKVGEYWMPTGIIVSLFFSYFRIKGEYYSIYLPYIIILIDVLIMYVLLWLFFSKSTGDFNEYDLSTGPVAVIRILHWQAVIAMFVFGWLIGDGVYFLWGGKWASLM